MGKQKSKPNEWKAMEQLFEILKEFDSDSRGRMLEAVEQKILADHLKAKPRKTRKDAGKAREHLNEAARRTDALARALGDRLMPDLPDVLDGSPPNETDRQSRDWALRS